jgi:hypothetical protein
MSDLVQIEKDGHIMFVTEHKFNFLKPRGWKLAKKSKAAPKPEPESVEAPSPEEDE